MFQRFKGLFNKWYCPSCDSILKRCQIKYQEEFRGHYFQYKFRCLNCGKAEGVETLKERLEKIARSK